MESCLSVGKRFRQGRLQVPRLEVCDEGGRCSWHDPPPCRRCTRYASLTHSLSRRIPRSLNLSIPQSSIPQSLPRSPPAPPRTRCLWWRNDGAGVPPSLLCCGSASLDAEMATVSRIHPAPPGTRCLGRNGGVGFAHGFMHRGSALPDILRPPPGGFTEESPAESAGLEGADRNRSIRPRGPSRRHPSRRDKDRLTGGR